MKKRLLTVLLAAGVLVSAAFTAWTIPAAAQQVHVQLPTGEVVPVDVPPGTDPNDIQLPGPIVQPTTPAPAPTTPETTPKPTTTPAPAPQTTPAPKPQEPDTGPSAGGGSPQGRSNSGVRVRRDEGDGERRLSGDIKSRPKNEPSKKKRSSDNGDGGGRAPLRNDDGTPSRNNPGFIDALPGPSTTTGVPNFIIRKFRVPPFLLPIYQAAGIEYGIRWEILAAINEIETDYGRNLNVSTAGALGWMQFMPPTWQAYGVDANKDGRKDPYNPVDAIFAAARYLKAADYENDVRAAIWAYNHADWYVDSVLLRARLIAGVPADLIGSLTGLTEGRFPVYARATYSAKLRDGRKLRIYSRPRAPVVAVNDGVIKKVGRHVVVLEDPYGNRYMYSNLDATARFYPEPKHDPDALGKRAARALPANRDPVPRRAASAGAQDTPPKRPAPRGSLPVKERLFAHPSLPGARANGGLEQMLELRAGQGYEVFDAYFSRPFGLDPSKVRLRRLEPGARVIGGTILGRARQLDFAIRPAGRGAPKIDPKPILDGWKLLEETAIFRASGRNVLRGPASAGQVLLLPKTALERRVLADERIEIYECGRDDIRSGQIDRRVLATLAFLAESGLEPTVTSLNCGHSFYTTSGNVSHHSSGNAVDIAMINGIPILGHQEPGGVADQAVRALLNLQGSMAPAQIISLLELGGPTLAMADHADHIHVGFAPQAGTVFGPSVWDDLLERLGDIENPAIPADSHNLSAPFP